MKIISRIMNVILIFSIVQVCTGNTGKELLRLNSDNVQSYPSLGQVCVSHKGKDFTVYHQGRSAKVKKHDVDSVLRNMSQPTLKRFLKNGKIKVNRFDNGDYSIKAHVTGKGGGPVTAGIFYGATKAIAWGGMIAAATASVAVTAPVGGTIAVAIASEGMVAGAGTVAAVIGTSTTATAVATVATEGALVVATGTGGVAAVVGGIEIAAAWMSAIGMALPLP